MSAIEVIEPATEQVMAELASAGVAEVDEAVARAKAAFPAWRAVEPACAAQMRQLDAIEAHAGELAELGGPQRRQADLRRAGGDRDGRRDVPLLRGRARAPARQDDPGRGRRGHDLPRAARRRRPDHTLELPAGDRLWKVAPALAAGNTIVLDGWTCRRWRWSWRGSPWAPACPREANVVAGPGSVCGQRLVEHPGRGEDRLHRLNRGLPIAAGAAGTIKRVTLEPRQVGERSSPTPTSRPPRPPRRWPSSEHARTAARARASSSSALRWTTSSPPSRARSRRSTSAIRWRTTRRWAADLRRAARDGLLFVPDDAPVAIRGGVPDGPGYWFPPTVLAPVSNWTAPPPRRSSARSPA